MAPTPHPITSKPKAESDLRRGWRDRHAADARLIAKYDVKHRNSLLLAKAAYSMPPYSSAGEQSAELTLIIGCAVSLLCRESLIRRHRLVVGRASADHESEAIENSSKKFRTGFTLGGLRFWF